MNKLFDLDSYDYPLPQDRIAQRPAETRTGSKLMVYSRSSGAIEHARFHDLAGFLPTPLLMVFNNTRVTPAKIFGVRERNHKEQEFLVYRKQAAGVFLVLTKNMRRFRDNDRIRFGDVSARVKNQGDRLQLTVSNEQAFLDFMNTHGEPPLPPYIKRPDGSLPFDAERYQTTYARHPGSVAAPTAGLHFTSELIDSLRARGIDTAYITLHVSLGTFAPVRSQDLRAHKMDPEYVSVDQENAARIAGAMKQDIPVLAVGTTSLKCLEGVYRLQQQIAPFEGNVDLFIHPPFTFHVVDHLLTNFHLPKSTLLMLVAAFAGIAEIKHCYRVAVEQGYRFFSYGDAMLIL